MTYYLVDDGRRVALVAAEGYRVAIDMAEHAGLDGAKVSAAMVDPTGTPMVLWVQGEPIGARF